MERIQCTGSDQKGVVIPLDGGIRSSLDWQPQIEDAKKAADSGEKLFWELDLGLFSRLHYPLSGESQLLTLKLSFQHFLEKVWTQFERETLGLSFYRGPLDFSREIPWDEEAERKFQKWGGSLPLKEEQARALYSKQIAGEYLELLAGASPDELDLYALAESCSIGCPVADAYLKSSEGFETVRLAVRQTGSEYRIEGRSEEPAALLLPELEFLNHDRLLPLLERVEREEREEYRVIPELLLTSQWDGLDRLYIDEQSMTTAGRRMVQGLEAAGGSVLG